MNYLSMDRTLKFTYPIFFNQKKYKKRKLFPVHRPLPDLRSVGTYPRVHDDGYTGESDACDLNKLIYTTFIDG